MMVSSTDLVDMVSSGLSMVEHMETSARPARLASCRRGEEVWAGASSRKVEKGRQREDSILWKTQEEVTQGIDHLRAARYLSPEAEGVTSTVVWSFSRLGL